MQICNMYDHGDQTESFLRPSEYPRCSYDAKVGVNDASTILSIRHRTGHFFCTSTSYVQLQEPQEFCKISDL
ncbi:unnamed protein product [Amaranthus hypochondriacus]